MGPSASATVSIRWGWLTGPTPTQLPSPGTWSGKAFRRPPRQQSDGSCTRPGWWFPNPRKRPKSSYLRFQAELPNGCWQADLTYSFLAAGTRVEILDFLDDHSRLLLTIQAKALWTSADVVTVMDQLITTYGPPAATLTDNGMVFTARFTARPGAKNGFEKLLAAHQIQQRNGAPGHPQTQGKIERFHQTLKRWLGARPLPETITELQAMLDLCCLV